MPIRFECPHCGQSLRARDDKVGRKLKCPKCQQSLTVPSDIPPGLDEGAPAGGADDPFSELIVYDDEIIYETEDAPGSALVSQVRPAGGEAFEPRHVAVPRWMFYAHAGLLALLAVVAFGAGWLIGGSQRQTAVVTAPLRPVEIEGHLKWEATTGEIGDKDAVVIVLPVDRTPQKKFAAAALTVDKPPLKPGDPVFEEIKELGGDYVRAGAGGQFYIQLVPGKYRVLLISRNAQLPAGINPKPEDVAALGAIFTPPEAILGRQKYRLSTLDLDEKSKIKHFFGESGK